MKKVLIGNQNWMSRNLDVPQFRNGDLITEAKTWKEWEKGNENKTPMYCYYDFDPENDSKYGKFYNWFAVSDSRLLAPEGYYIPTDNDWVILAEFIGEENELNYEDDLTPFLKSRTSWADQRNGDDQYSFNAIASGKIDMSGMCEYAEVACYWWSVSEEGESGGQMLAGNPDFARYRGIGEYDEFMVGKCNKMCGLSVRCLCEE